jgi:hypothetical protein
MACRVTKRQRFVLGLLLDGYVLGSHFAPRGRWHVAIFRKPRQRDKRVYVIGERTVMSLHRKGVIAGNIAWPHVTAVGWAIARSLARK